MGQSQLQTLLEGIEGVQKVYLQAPQNVNMVYPCILYERDDSVGMYADNTLYALHKRYTVTVIDRDSDSVIPDKVEALPFARFNRFFRVDGLNHFVFQLFF